MKRIAILQLLICFCSFSSMFAEDGSRLWMPVEKNEIQADVQCSINGETAQIAAENLRNYWHGKQILLQLNKKNSESKGSYQINSNKDQIKITSASEIGLLYAAYHLLRLQQLGLSADDELHISEKPSYAWRILNHWDNLDGSIERGYAGSSIFWRSGETHPTVTHADREKWLQYARANAFIGINGSVLNNVNASPKILSSEYLQKAKAIAEVLRPYGIRIFLSINFASPTLLDSLKTSDPLNDNVKKWWHNKVKEIYTLIPDFGGFLVKANSEGQSGPQDFGRTHADGANMLAKELKPYQGIVMWRAFVYNPTNEDRAKQAFNEFMPLDGQFLGNVIIQVKNGPIDFQPREPFSPLFGAMKKTSVMPELQITQEYLGQSVQLVFLAPMWQEFLQSDTHQQGADCTVARCTDGSIYSQKNTAIAGVANIGMDTNWCGHPFAQANWYAFGRLAWCDTLQSVDIAEEWLHLTFLSKGFEQTDFDSHFIEPMKAMMLESHEAAVNYMMPMGLHHLFADNHHYGPAPWSCPPDFRPDWTPPYYHQADSIGLGFDRTHAGSNAVSQYAEPLRMQFDDITMCPENLLLWFHHVPWDYRMKNGRSMWENLCYKYDEGVRQVRGFQKDWDKVERYVDAERFEIVQHKLRRHVHDAIIWKDACILYFQQYSRRPIPYDIDRPETELPPNAKLK